jgi:hypothetical protein
MRRATNDSHRHGPVRRAGTIVALLALVAGTAAGCGDDDAPSTDDPDQSAGEVLESAGARGVAEAVRVALVAEDLGPDEHERDVDVIEESIEDLPVDPDVEGLTDDDGDGRDDDGRVEVRVNSEAACISIAMDGDVDVTGGAC